MRSPGLLLILAGSAALAQAGDEPGPLPAPQHQPPVVTPGAASTAPPSDAIVLFDGRDLSQWLARNGGEPPWGVKDGYLEVVPRTGDIVTKADFGDAQLHIEWATPAKVAREGQHRGNSGVFFMQRYEVQILDSYENETYAHGQAGAIYKQSAPLVNASRPPGEWQVYDIVFRAPRFDDDGTVIERARVTVFHNGVLVQDAVPVLGGTAHDRPAVYVAHEPRAPIRLQDHGDAVRFRNIWVRRL